MHRVLNVGGGNKQIPLPPEYSGWEILWLDIDPKFEPDILCDARNLTSLDKQQFDAIYCSHNLEHYYEHDVQKVLSGFRHVLKKQGFADIRVPDLKALMEIFVEKGLDIDDVLYEAPIGPITTRDVIYGYAPEIRDSGNDFFAHKTGFTPNTLRKTLTEASFSTVYTATGNLEVRAIGFAESPTQEALQMFGLSQIPI